MKRNFFKLDNSTILKNEKSEFEFKNLLYIWMQGKTYLIDNVANAGRGLLITLNGLGMECMSLSHTVDLTF